MGKKIILIIIVLILGFVFLIPFMLRMANNRSSPASTGPAADSAVPSSGAGVLISLDGGENWANVSRAGGEKNNFPTSIFGLTFHPRDPETVFLGAKSAGLWKSADGGKSWNKLTDKNGSLAPASDVYKIAVSGSDPKIIYLAAYQNNRGRIFKSEDDGEHFKEIYFVSKNRFGIFDLSVNPDDSKNVLTITGQGGLLETKDGGKTWRVKKWFTKPLLQLLVNPLFADEIYLITGDNILFKTFDKGNNWIDLSSYLREGLNSNKSSSQAVNGSGGFITGGFSFSGNAKIALNTLILDPNSPNTLYMSSGNTLMRSQDGGYTWESIQVLVSPDAPPVSAIAIKPGNPDIIFAVSGTQMYKSANKGIDWKIINLPTSKKIKTLYIHPQKPEVMIAVLQ